jgi:hypothetical protein
MHSRSDTEFTQADADALEERLSALLTTAPASAAQKRAVAAKAAEDLGSVITKGLVGGLGSAIGGFGVGEILDKLESRAFDELAAREPAGTSLGPVTKGLIGTGVSIAASSAIEDGIDKLKGLFDREIGLNGLD